ncbi:MAG: hypothetical protein KF718_33110 [Polyangiaceae bacterium]|nr:hypothetical protein [Polyangiaceae bacterium]
MRRLVPALLVATLFVSGCGNLKKTKECSAFIDRVNTALSVIQQHTNTAGKEDAKAAADMKKLGELYEQLSKDVGALEITTPDLKTHTGEYQAMAAKAAAAARQVAEAIEKKDPQQAESAQTEFDKIVKQEDELVNKINGYCQAR